MCCVYDGGYLQSSGMFDRSVVLGNRRKEIEDQLRYTLLDTLRQSVKG